MLAAMHSQPQVSQCALKARGSILDAINALLIGNRRICTATNSAPQSVLAPAVPTLTSELMSSDTTPRMTAKEKVPSRKMAFRRTPARALFSERRLMPANESCIQAMCRPAHVKWLAAFVDSAMFLRACWKLAACSLTGCIINNTLQENPYYISPGMIYSTEYTCTREEAWLQTLQRQHA